MNISNRLGVSLFLIATFAIVSLAGRQAATAPTNVLVTNSTSQAVPVKPASGSAFAVAVTNTPNVHAYITNAVTGPVPTTDLADKAPFEMILRLNFADGSSSQSTLFQVPTGKRLIVESIGVNSGSDLAGQFVQILNVGAESTFSEEGYATLIPTPAPGNTLGYANQLVKLDVEPQHFLFANGYRIGTSGVASADVTVVGHYVPVP